MPDLLPIKTATSLHFPNIDPVAFSIGPLHIHWYGLGYLFGIVFAFIYCNSLLNRPFLWAKNTAPCTSEQLSDFIFWATLGIIIGGRLGEVLLWNPQYYRQHPAEIIAIWHGGMAFHGGLLGVVLCGLIFAYKNRINYLSLFDLVAAGAPIGLGLVRVCNFINGELWGKPTTAAWGMVFPHADQLARHPSQLYEAVLEGPLLFIILGICIFYLRSFYKPGFTVGVFSIGYGLARILAEIFREPDAAPAWFSHCFSPNIFSYGMFLSIPMIVTGMGLIVFSQKKCLNSQEL